ncbi:MAG: RagB/SusD family nutrient uptake outer membrane protein [Pseudobacter sp.]|uniref:RagB/SusD family nutrient uptake outer membrane protein n=1 Tax=Pseudobacter sp. TaxID=2045420 RepID=UPI003F7E05DB
MKYIQIVLITLVATLTGCKKFLDVTPNDKVFENELFTNRDGFENALADVYYGLTTPALYGRELKYGMLDVMAGYWNIPAQQNPYSNIIGLNYQLPAYQPMISGIWSGLYTAINKTNTILKNIENIKDDKYYSLIKGEATGMRAFAHLELLRLFGSSIKQEGAGAKAIPYYQSAGNLPQPFLSAGEVIERVERDLSEAELLLKNDTIKTIGRTTNGNGFGTIRYNSLIDRRGIRMNFYAVLGLKARLSMWAGKQEEAYTRANAVITELQSNQQAAIRLITSTDVTSRNKRFAVENLFGLYIYNHRDMLAGYLPDITATASPVLVPQYTYLMNNLYRNSVHGSANDYRWINWFGVIGTNQYRFTKLEIDTLSTATQDQFEVNMIALPEMYFIMAETKVATDPQLAMQWLNRLRLSRNLSAEIPYDPATTTQEMVMNFIIDESRKEYPGEGYVYLMYKRMYRPMVRPTGTIQPDISVYRLPIPVDETIYNNP